MNDPGHMVRPLSISAVYDVGETNAQPYYTPVLQASTLRDAPKSLFMDSSGGRHPE